MVNVGLDTGPVTPSARAAPPTKVVFPAPSPPATATTAPGRRRAASRAATARVSSGEAVTTSIRRTLEQTELDRLDRRDRGRLGCRLGFGPAAPQQLRNSSKVLLEHLQHPRRVERSRGMEDRIQRYLVAAEHHLLFAAVHLRDPGRLP